MFLIRFPLPALLPEALIFGVVGGVVGGVVILAWWLTFSRARWVDRVGAPAVVALVFAAIWPLLHESIQNGMMGMMFFLYAIPIVSIVFVAATAATRHLADGPRRAVVVAAIVLATGALTSVRTDGLTGGGESQFAWRWTLTAEERLLARTTDEPGVGGKAEGLTGELTHQAVTNDLPEAPWQELEPSAVDQPMPVPDVATVESLAATEPVAARVDLSVDRTPGSVAWPGFRGAGRDAVVRGLRVETDWSSRPPVEIWRRVIGPGWSSFAVADGVFYTQEQRGDDEIVSAYDVATGEPVWRHRDTARFWESNGGAGPRGTPTLYGGRVYALGATGILNSLDARTGAVVWSRNVASNADVPVPDWGFSGSPIVIDDLVIVATSGVLSAYDATTGEPRWVNRAPGGGSYSSPHLTTIDGVPQVLFVAGGGIRSVTPADGSLLWMHEWSGAPIVQPAPLGDGHFLVTTAGNTGPLGMRRLAVAREAGGWVAETRWTSNGLKPYFNDFVVHRGHAYGFDGFILACIDLADGTRTWKGGRYGYGQMVLLADQDALLVLSEEGEIALVSATPDRFTELARAPAIEGKTWNHPAIVGDVLLVRNGEEMAAFRLPLEGR